MEIICNKLRCQRGDMALRLGALAVVFAFVLFTVMQIARFYFVLDGVQEKTNEAVLAVAAINVPEFYGGAREGEGQARHPLGDGGFESLVSTDDVLAQMATTVGAEMTEENVLLKQGNFAIEDLSVQYVNQSGGNLNFKTTLTVQIFFSFGNFKKHMNVYTSYAPKF